MHIHIDTCAIAKALLPQPVPLKVGTRVRIIPRVCSMDGKYSYHGRYIGCAGRIVKLPESFTCACVDADHRVSVGVQLDGHINERSQYGCYWFDISEIRVENEQEDTNMILLKGYKVIKVDVNGCGEQLVASYESEISEFDSVVIAAGDSSDAYRCGIVSATNVHTTCVPKWQVVQKIDDSAFNSRIVRAQKAKELEDRLRDAANAYQQIAMYEMLAEKNPEIAALLKELKEVTDV